MSLICLLSAPLRVHTRFQASQNPPTLGLRRSLSILRFSHLMTSGSFAGRHCYPFSETISPVCRLAYGIYGHSFAGWLWIAQPPCVEWLTWQPISPSASLGSNYCALRTLPLRRVPEKVWRGMLQTGATRHIREYGSVFLQNGTSMSLICLLSAPLRVHTRFQAFG